MGVGAEAAVGIEQAVVVEHHAGEVLDVDLMDDACIGRHGLEVLQRFLTPAEEGVALGVAFKFHRGVQVEGFLAAVVVDHHRVVDHEFHRAQRVHLGRVAAQLLDGVAHGREVHHAGHAGEVLQDHAGGGEVDVLGRQGFEIGASEGFDVGLGGVGAVFVPEEVFQQDFVGVGQAGQIELAGERIEVEVLELPITDFERGAGVKTVGHGRLRAGDRSAVGMAEIFAGPRPGIICNYGGGL